VGVRVGVAKSIGIDKTNTFQLKSIGIDKTNTFQLKFSIYHQNLGATVLGGLWALEWAWHSTETNFALRKKLRNLHAKSQ